MISGILFGMGFAIGWLLVQFVLALIGDII